MVLGGVDHIKDLVGQLDEAAGCGITHLGKVERDDAGPFTGQDVTELLEALPYFLSLAAGRWTAPVLPIGFDNAGSRTWEQWGPSPKSSWGFRHSWFPEHHPQCLGDAFPGFMSRWSDPHWREALRIAVHWYVDSNSQGVAVEGGLVLCQLALELLAASLFVEDRRTYSEGNFDKKFPAVDKVRLLTGGGQGGVEHSGSAGGPRLVGEERKVGRRPRGYRQAPQLYHPPDRREPGSHSQGVRPRTGGGPAVSPSLSRTGAALALRLPRRIRQPHYDSVVRGTGIRPVGATTHPANIRFIAVAETQRGSLL